MKTKFALATGAVLSAALLLTACSGGSAPSPEGESNASDPTTVLYSTVKEQATGVIVDTGAALDPALKVDVVTGGSTAMLQRIEAENGVNSADLFYSTAPYLFDDYLDLFLDYDSPEAAAIPEEYQYAGKPFTVVNLMVTALMVNTQVLGDNEVPKTWKDLTAPSWKGKIITADPGDSTTAYIALYGAYQVLGEEGFKKLAENLVVTDNSATTYTSVAQGEFAVTLGYEHNIYPFIAGGQPGVELVYLDDGTFVMDDAAAVVKSAAHPENAKRLLDALLTEESQVKMLENSYRRPIRADIDVSSVVDLPATEDLKILPLEGANDEDLKAEFLEFWGSLPR